MSVNMVKTTVKTRGAVIYTRVSTGEQDKHGTSPETQRDACREKALALSLPIIAEYHDGGISGGFLLARPGMQSALADIQAGRADTLICPNISRYSRDVEHQQAVKKAVRAAGGRLVFCDMDFEDTPEGDLNFTIQGGFAEYERKVIRQRTMKGKRKRAEDGQQPARATSPYGYRIVTKADVLRGDYSHDRIGQYQIVEDQARIVREIFSRYAAGGHSLNQIAKWLNTEGIPTPGKATYWWASGLRYILTNTVYRGEAHFGQVAHRKEESRLSEINPQTSKPFKQPIVRRASAPEDVVDLACPAIVDAVIWDQVSARLSQNRNDCGGNPDRVRMLTGKVFCPNCGGRMVSGAGGRNSYVNVRGETLYYKKERRYLCIASTKRYNVTGEYSCTSASYMIRRTEEAAVLAVGALLDTKQTPGDLREALQAFRMAEAKKQEAQETPESPQNPAAMRREKTALDKALSELADDDLLAVQAQMAGMKSGASPDAYAAVFAELAGRRKDLEDRRGVLTRRLQTLDQQEKSPTPKSAGHTGKAQHESKESLATRALALAYEVLTSDAVPNAKKRAIIGTLVDKVICRMDGAEVVFLPGVIAIEENSGADGSDNQISEEGFSADTEQPVSMILARTSICRTGLEPKFSILMIFKSGGRD